MVSLAWHRSAGSFNNQGDYALLATLNAGQTIIRTRFNFNLAASGADLSETLAQQGEGCYVGLVTTIGNGGELVPSALTDLTDANPPSERWLWWEGRYLYINAYTGAASQSTLTAAGPAEPTDSKAQVLAPTMGAGDSLHLWLSWSVTASWPIGLTYDPYLQWWAGVLVRTP